MRDNPNSYLDVLLTVENSWVLLIFLGYPFSLLVQTPHYFLIPCSQPLVFLGVFTITAMVRVSYSLILRLRNPYSTPRDMIKVDSFLAGTNRTLFTDLRIAFRSTPGSGAEATPSPTTNGGNDWIGSVRDEMEADLEAAQKDLAGMKTAKNLRHTSRSRASSEDSSYHSAVASGALTPLPSRRVTRSTAIRHLNRERNYTTPENVAALF